MYNPLKIFQECAQTEIVKLENNLGIGGERGIAELILDESV